MKDADLERFTSKTRRTEGSCLEWTAGLGRGGYGKFKAEGRTAPAHQWMWEHFNGPVPEGFDLHHTCGNRKCVERAHVVDMTRADHRALHTAQRTHCKHGHEFTEVNTYWRQKEGEAPYRGCRECDRLHARRWYYENREKAIAMSTAYIKAHPEANSVRVKAAYWKDPELFRARARAFAAAHPEKVREYRQRTKERAMASALMQEQPPPTD